MFDFLKLLSTKERKKKRKSLKRFSNKKSSKTALKLLEVTINTLNEHNIKYYLDFGTLIGAVRDKGFIPWDDDVDICLFDEKDYHKAVDLLNSIAKQGFRTSLNTFYESIRDRKYKIMKNKQSGIFVDEKEINFTNIHNYKTARVKTNTSPFVSLFTNQSTIYLDIFFKYVYKNNNYWMALNRINKVDVMVDELIEINFYHLKCTIPKNYDEYLTAVYGNWKIPNKSWIQTDNLTHIKKGDSFETKQL